MFVWQHIYDALDRALDGRDWVRGELSIADVALFPHLSSTRMLQISFDEACHQNLLAWYKRCRSVKIFADDLARTKEYVTQLASMDIEREKIDNEYKELMETIRWLQEILGDKNKTLQRVA